MRPAEPSSGENDVVAGRDERAGRDDLLQLAEPLERLADRSDVALARIAGERVQAVDRDETAAERGQAVPDDDGFFYGCVLVCPTARRVYRRVSV